MIGGIMRIAQVAPLFERVPPVAYGGTERVVAYLTDALVELGHDVTLFASGDSQTSARLVAAAPRSLRLDTTCRDTMAPQIRELEQVSRMAHHFDVIHFHTGFLHLPLTRHLAAPSLTTMHGRLDFNELAPMLGDFADAPFVSISNHQRRPYPHQNWCATVYHGQQPRHLPFRASPPRFVAFVGRISPEKRLDRAIEIARRAGLELRVAAKIDAVDRDYFDSEIGPLMSQPHVRYLGEIGDEEKAALLGGARALLFPIDWPEPFGMVVIEALSCGTPVLAWREGSVPELLEPGVTGWIVDSIDAAVHSLKQVDAIDRRGCRAAFEKRFTAERMARDYLAVYKRLRESTRDCLEARTA
jgi:glycosyltransferase involved in cell wall biosynthesis